MQAQREAESLTFRVDQSTLTQALGAEPKLIFLAYLNPILTSEDPETLLADLDVLHERCQLPWRVWNQRITKEHHKNSKLYKEIGEPPELEMDLFEKHEYTQWLNRLEKEYLSMPFLFGRYKFMKTESGHLDCKVDVMLPTEMAHMIEN